MRAGLHPHPAAPLTSPLLRWPLPALVTWALAWAGFLLFAQFMPLPAAVGCAVLVGVLPAIWLRHASTMRRTLLALGFPLSFAASGWAASVPGWTWLLPLALLLLAYPVSAWRDAPLFPTPAGALDALSSAAPLPPGAAVLDAGCGLGHGLAALRRAYPQARLAGVERSLPIALLGWLRSRRAPVAARVRHGDMWAEGAWRGHALVYMFQRPETLPRAVAKARRELAPGAWLASLEFEAAELRSDAMLRLPDGRPLWLYRAPFAAAGTPATSRSPRSRR